jgi:RNA polymerase sigma factor (TIGR02999 family)
MVMKYFWRAALSAEVSTEITGLLRAWGAGDTGALERLIPRVYNDLRRAARRHMRNERPGNTLESTALVHEAFLRLVDVQRADWKDRAHFFAVASQMMRRILVDAARARLSAKRGGDLQREEHSGAPDLDQIPDLSSRRDGELLAIHEALDALVRIDARKARVIELRFFGGMSVDETAVVLAVSPQTVMRDWKLAKAWLTRELKKKGLGSKRLPGN